MPIIVMGPARGSAAWHQGRHPEPIASCSTCRTEHPTLFGTTRKQEAAARVAARAARIAYVRGTGPYRPA